MTAIPTLTRSYHIIYFKRGHYWQIEALGEDNQTLATLSHIDNENRPYQISHNLIDTLYPTYAEACSVFLNLLRQGR